MQEKAASVLRQLLDFLVERFPRLKRKKCRGDFAEVYNPAVGVDFRADGVQPRGVAAVVVAVNRQECLSSVAESSSDVLELDLIFRQQALPVKRVAGQDDSQALRICATVP